MNALPEILIADDSKSNRVTLAAQAAALDIDLLIADSGFEVLRLAAKHQPAVIVLDIEMEDMDGYQIINRLAGSPDTANIPIILLETNFASVRRRLHGDLVWASEILYKPIDVKAFHSKLGLLLEMHTVREAISAISEFEKEMSAGADEGILGIDRAGHIRYTNPAMIKLLRTRYSDLIGTGVESIFEKDFHDAQASWPRHPVAKALASNRTVQVKRAVLWSNDGAKVNTTFVAIPVPNHPTVAGILVFKNVARAATQSVEDSALVTHDSLTGLASRFKFEEILSGLIDLYRAKTNVLISRKRAAPCAVLAIGLDHFAHINKGLGHDIGDKLLRGVAHRIKHCVNELDLVSRIGGDEFAVALTHMFDASEATRAAQAIQGMLDDVFLVDGTEIYASASIGIATYPECGDTAVDLLTHATLAMQTAKEKGRHGIQFYTDALNQHYLQKLQLEGDLRLAMAADELAVTYRPVFEPTSGAVVGHQASVAWAPDSHVGESPAAELLSTIHSPRLLTKLTYTTLLTACRDYSKWRAQQDNTELQLLVPFPAFHLLNDNFFATLKGVLAESGLPPGALILEIVNTEVDVNLSELTRLAGEINGLGVHLALALFSGPRTPITHLLSLNIHTVRLDQQLIDDVLDDPRTSIFVKGIITMAHELGVRVIADGIRSDHQVKFLQMLGCDALQGERFGTAQSLPAQLQGPLPN